MANGSLEPEEVKRRQERLALVPRIEILLMDKHQV